MHAPSMTAEAAISPASSQGYGLSTASNQRANASVTPAQDTCHVVCGNIGYFACHITCPAGQQAWCHCENYGFVSHPTCRCIDVPQSPASQPSRPPG